MVIVVYNHLISSVGRVGRRLMTAAAATERDSQPGTRRKQKRARWAGNNDAQLGKGGDDLEVSLSSVSFGCCGNWMNLLGTSQGKEGDSGVWKK